MNKRPPSCPQMFLLMQHVVELCRAVELRR
jgi:hypothetical protein